MRVTEIFWAIDHAGDDDEHGGQELPVLLCRVCDEKLLSCDAIADSLVALCHSNGIGFHFGNVAADVSFREGKPGDLSARKPRKILGFLLCGAEEAQGFWHADRLRCRQ